MLLALDLDGTLRLNDQGLIPSERKALLKVRKKGHIPVLITGRNLWSLRKVIKEEDGFEYICYSSGAGIIPWPIGHILRQLYFEDQQQRAVKSILDLEHYDYFIQQQLPENHYHWPVFSSKAPPDYFRRMEKYKSWRLHSPPEKTSQFLIILKKHKDRLALMEKLKTMELPISMIQTTSPMDHRTPWLEIFPPQGNKGGALSFLCRSIDYPLDKTIALGNDWNDIDMLELAGNSWVVPGAPEELIKRFNITPKESLLSPLEFLVQGL
jgi:HAD superfamily hydrolase (TIGR01484 family)